MVCVTEAPPKPRVFLCLVVHVRVEEMICKPILIRRVEYKAVISLFHRVDVTFQILYLGMKTLQTVELLDKRGDQMKERYEKGRLPN